MVVTFIPPCAALKRSVGYRLLGDGMVSAGKSSDARPGWGSIIEWASAMVALPEPVFGFKAVRDPDGKVVELTYAFLNDAGARLYGKSVDEVLGHGKIELFPSVKELGIWDTYLGVIESGSPASLVVPFFHENGVEGSFRLTATKYCDGLLVSATDITEQVAAKKVLEADRAALRASADSVLDPLVRFEAVRDESGAIIDFLYADANPAACAYDRMDYDELVGSRLLTLLPGHVGTGLLEMYAQVVETGEPLILDDFAYELELRGGQQRRFDIRAARIGDGLSYTWRDVTDRHLQALHDRRMAAIIEQSKDAIIGASLPDWLVTLWNPAAETIYGYTAEEMVGRSYFILTTPEDRDRSQAIADTLASGESLPAFDAVRLRKDGTRVAVAVTPSPILDTDGEVIGVVTFHRDITERVKAADQQKQRLAELEQFQRLTVGRELKMIELKKEIEYLKTQMLASGSDPDHPLQT